MKCQAILSIYCINCGNAMSPFLTLSPGIPFDRVKVKQQGNLSMESLLKIINLQYSFRIKSKTDVGTTTRDAKLGLF